MIINSIVFAVLSKFLKLQNKTNSSRIAIRNALIDILTLILKTEKREHWLDGLEELGVPASPVKDIAQVFADPQIQHRGMRISVPH